MEIQGNNSIFITRIDGGIPQITAGNDEDLYRGLGYCHAMDRGLQMLMMKILGTGTAAQYLSGNDHMVEIDRFFRRMNWHTNLGDEVDKLEPHTRRLLEAYCTGVNDGFTKYKPWEFRFLLGYKDYNWTMEHTMLLVRMTGYLTLAQSQGEVERLFLQLTQRGVREDLLEEMFPGILGGLDAGLLRKVHFADKLVPDSVRWNTATAAFMASNNWAIAGSRTESGHAILANDPHLEINRLPSIWYEVSGKAGDKWVHAATMPGLPSFLIGRTKALSWGATYSFMDAHDSWIEQCRDGKYLKEGNWCEFAKRSEVIRRKKGKAVEVHYYENEHGILDQEPDHDGYFLATRWSGDKSGAQSIEAGFAMWDATTVEQGMKAAGNIESTFSWVFADSRGNIGYQMSGLLPRRREGVSGFVPLPGWVAENDWKGYYPPEDLPRIYNPPEGYIITANNDLNHLGNVPPINICMGSYRADRIRELIDSTEKVDIDFIKSMQVDLHSRQAEQFMKIVVPLLPDSRNAAILREWDFCYDVGSEGAYLFEMLYRRLYHEVFGSALGFDLNQFLWDETGAYTDFYGNFDAILLATESRWFMGKGRESIYRSAIDYVLTLEPRTWGDINKITMNHLLLGEQLPGFFGFNRGPYALPGGRATIQQGQIYKSAGRISSFAPSVRFICDMGQQAIHTNLAGGVSDRRFSKLYNNAFADWQSARYREYRYSSQRDQM